MFEWGGGLFNGLRSAAQGEPSQPDTGAGNEDDCQFRGFDGATSLKAEMAGRIPELCDAATYREARELLARLGGAESLLSELVFSGFVNPDDYTLTTKSKPFNVFALIAVGEIKQQGLKGEQEALGKYAEKFVICANKPENNLHWDSKDPYWLPKASMGKRHRFLTTKDLHWQWFNALTFGVVPPDIGGVSVRDAVKHVEEMKAAALHYAKNVGGWSDNVGLFVNVFGHNNVNSLFIHVLDMNELGPSFQFHKHKNCPLDEVLKVLREEAISTLLPTRPKSFVRLPGLRDRTRTSQIFFAGTDGATSLKQELVARVPVLRDAAGYREARRLLKHELGGSDTLLEELKRAGFVGTEDYQLTTGVAPFNVFARIVGGKMTQPGLELEQTFLGDYQEKFMICGNRPENDEHWDSQSPEWVGKASMSHRHKFLLLKDLHWQWFNCLVLGMIPAEKKGVTIRTAIATLELMKAAALTYCANKGGWSKQVGLFFHCFGHNSVNSLHLHVLDMSELGPTFWKLESKNVPLDAVLRVLQEEVSVEDKEGNARRPSTYQESKTAARAASEAAASAAETMNSVQQMVKEQSLRRSTATLQRWTSITHWPERLSTLASRSWG